MKLNEHNQQSISPAVDLSLQPASRWAAKRDPAGSECNPPKLAQQNQKKNGSLNYNQTESTLQTSDQSKSQQASLKGNRFSMQSSKPPAASQSIQSTQKTMVFSSSATTMPAGKQKEESTTFLEKG